MRHCRTIVIFIVLLVGACASNHNLNEDGFNALGGGISVSELEPGTYLITAQTNFAPVESFETASKMWHEAALSACEPNKYSELESREYSYKNGPDFIIIPYIISVKTGKAHCVLSPTNKHVQQKR
jgi:hypothetical protein